MEAALRFSQNSRPGDANQRFLRVDVTGKAFQLCKITKESKRRVQYDTICSSTKVPAFRAFDWHPVRESLIVVGGSGGEATLLNIAEGQQDATSFSVRSQRLCNAVSLSSQNLIAVGLDRVRTDFCLNIWDFNQRVSPVAPSRNYAKGYSEPLHKLAGGEPITSLKFFNTDPQLLVAGVKGQFVRLYDLREPTSGNGLQFATRCVHNLAIDTQDETYFASCFPTTEPMVCLWDRRMNSRAFVSHGTYGTVNQPQGQPEASLEISDVTDSPGTVWSLRFSKSRRGCLGMLLSSGHLRAYGIEKDFVSETVSTEGRETYQIPSSQRQQDVYLDSIQDVERAYMQSRRANGEKKRVVSFDFLTSTDKSGQPKLIMLTGEGDVKITSLKGPPEPACISSVGFLCKGSYIESLPPETLSSSQVAVTLNRIRRSAEPRNALKQAYKQSKHNKHSQKDRLLDLRRMSSFANHSWNSDLGFFEKKTSVTDLLTLVAAPRLRCEAGYLLDTVKNRSVISDSQWIESYWSWIDRAERISRNNMMVQDNLDLSFVGVYNIWMEEINTGPRQRGASFTSIATVVKNLAHRLNLPLRKGCPTEYPWHRKLSLHISGLSWSRSELEAMVQRSVGSGQHTKAAAIAIFAEEEKLAFKALRSKTATQSHKMLAMAIAGAARRAERGVGGPSDSKDDSDSSDDDTEWTETITSLSSDLADPYARAILAYVRSGNWEDVVNEESLPLKHRLGVALRHLSDAELTEFVGRITREVITTGDIEGIVLTGTGTKEGLELLQSYARVFSDLQTAILGLSVGGAAARFLVLPSTENKAQARKLEAMRESYRSSIMSWGLKFDRVRFDVASTRALKASVSSSSASISSTGPHDPILPTPKQQIRLICQYCTQSLTQFPPALRDSSGGKSDTHPHHHQHNSSTTTASTQITPDKAAVLGTVCPKCGRHLPRCGVCDLWLGTPDDSFAKWYTDDNATSKNGGTQQEKSGGPGLKPNAANQRAASNTLGRPKSAMTNTTSAIVDADTSMSASIVTTLGPPTKPTTASGSTSTSASASASASTLPSRPQPPSHTNSLMNIFNTTDTNVDVGNTASQTNTNSTHQIQVQKEDQERQRKLRDERWAHVMHKFVVFCVACSHGFHAEHARMWFEGGGRSESKGDGEGVEGALRGEYRGHRVCPVAGCGCLCNG